MNPKIVNLLEKHVEKIVLAVAVLGAGWIVWSGIQPTHLPDNNDVTADNVEQKVSDAVADLQRVREQSKQKTLAELTPRLQDYVAEFDRVMLQHPLPQTMVASAAVPRFAPLQLSSGGIGPGPEGLTRIVVPTVPTPHDLDIAADRGTVVPPPLATNQPAPAPGAVQPVDKNWVVISGEIPWKQFTDALNDPKLPKTAKLAPNDQRAVLYRIAVERRTHNANGTWTAWTAVEPTHAAGDPFPVIDWNSLSDTDVLAAVNRLDASFQMIAEPTFYYIAPKELPPAPLQPGAGQPAPPPPAAPTQIVPPIIKKMDAAAATQRAPVGVPGRPGVATAPPPRPGALPPPRPYTPNPANPDETEGDTGSAPPPPQTFTVGGTVVDPVALKQQGDVPFWFYDETVEAGHDYQYRVRIEMYNPVYRYPGGLAKPEMKKEATLASSWVQLPSNNGVVSVSGDLYFFVNNAGLGGGGGAAAAPARASIQVYKWTNGGWYQNDWNDEPGQPLHDRIFLVDQGNKPIDVDTGYTLVDVRQGANGDLVAVFLTPAGELITHSANADSIKNNPTRQDLEKNRVRPVKQIRPAPGTPGGPPLPGHGTGRPQPNTPDTANPDS